MADPLDRHNLAAARCVGLKGRIDLWRIAPCVEAEWVRSHSATRQVRDGAHRKRWVSPSARGFEIIIPQADPERRDPLYTHDPPGDRLAVQARRPPQKTVRLPGLPAKGYNQVLSPAAATGHLSANVTDRAGRTWDKVMSTRFFRWQGLDVAVDVRPQVLRLEMDPFASWQEIRQGTYGRRQAKVESRSSKSTPMSGSRAPCIPTSLLCRRKARSSRPRCWPRRRRRSTTASWRPWNCSLMKVRQTSVAGLDSSHDLQVVLRDEWDRSPQDSSVAEAIGLLSAARSLAGDEDADPVNWPTAIRLGRSRHLLDSRMARNWTCHSVSIPGASGSLGCTARARRSRSRCRSRSHRCSPVPLNPTGRCGSLTKFISLSPLSATRSLGRTCSPVIGPPKEMSRRPAAFPASDSPEGRLVKRLVGNNPVPPGFDLIGELIARVGDGRLSLATTDESGWYDHVLHALEPLIVPDRTPEAKRLRLAEDYRDDLKDLFRSLLGAARETHVKQIESPTAGGCPLVVSPDLSFEPLAEHYRRRAGSYRFVRERLVELLGEDLLLSRNRLTPRGETGGPLLDGLFLMEQLYTGAWAIVLDELGLAPNDGQVDDRFIMTAKASARSWASSHRSDPDLGEDVRMMVPLFKDIERDEFHILAVVGFEQRNLRVSFVERPEVMVRDCRGCVVESHIDWSDARYPLARPVTITCRTKRLLDRDKFRTLCNQAGSVAEIRSVLEGK